MKGWGRITWKTKSAWSRQNSKNKRDTAWEQGGRDKPAPKSCPKHATPSQSINQTSVQSSNQGEGKRCIFVWSKMVNYAPVCHNHTDKVFVMMRRSHASSMPSMFSSLLNLLSRKSTPLCLFNLFFLLVWTARQEVPVTRRHWEAHMLVTWIIKTQSQIMRFTWKPEKQLSH